MKLRIKRLGHPTVLVFNKEDVSLWDLKEGDIVDVNIQKDIDWQEMKRRLQ